MKTVNISHLTQRVTDLVSVLYSDNVDVFRVVLASTRNRTTPVARAVATVITRRVRHGEQYESDRIDRRP